MEPHSSVWWTKESRSELISCIWPSTVRVGMNSSEERYSAFYEQVSLDLATLGKHPTSYVLNTVEEVIRVIRSLRKDRQLTRENAAKVVSDVAHGYQLQDATQERVWRTIEVIIRLWLTLDIRLAASQAIGPYRTLSLEKAAFILWVDQGSLQNAVATYFENFKNSQSFETQGTKVEPTLTLEYLVHVHGLSIHWTSNLAEHLLLDPSTREVTVYEHKICLMNHLREENSVIPIEVLQETIDTLNFLLPFENKATKSFLNRHKKPIYGLGRCNRDLNLELDTYVYWRGRIEALLEIIKEPPRGFQQLRLDKTRHDMTHVLSFWIAVAVALLTVMSFVFGVISTVYAKKQYEVGMLQYRLALRQACSAPEAAGQLPEFCS